MANFDFDSNADGEWDDSWETIWNESDWERYLKSEDRQVYQYQRLYASKAQDVDRLDKVASSMGWDARGDSSSGDHSDQLTELPESEPYTLHKHPLYIANKALHRWLSENWKQEANKHSDRLSIYSALSLQEAISKSDEYGLLAVTALDLADFSLAIAYIKRGFAHLNALLARLSSIDHFERESLSEFVSQARMRIFDIREIWLRVAADCRAASESRFEED
jgi:hypothetical protein